MACTSCAWTLDKKFNLSSDERLAVSVRQFVSYFVYIVMKLLTKTT